MLRLRRLWATSKQPALPKTPRPYNGSHASATATALAAAAAATTANANKSLPSCNPSADTPSGGQPTLVEQEIEDIEHGPLRYAAYARRAVQVFLVKGRLIAYTSDVGESVRPVVPPAIVRACYGITWAYVGVDVGFRTSEEYRKGSETSQIVRTAVHTACFQTIASVLVPSVVIHQVVHVAQNLAAARLPAGRIARWLPSAVGLACIPLMPLIDHPVEHAIDIGFEYAWPKDSGWPAMPSPPKSADKEAKKN